MAFRFHAKKVFLTYPQCILDGDEVLAYMKEHWPRMQEYYIAQEEHEEGGKHIHAAIVFMETIDTKNERYFDITIKAQDPLEMSQEERANLGVVDELGTDVVYHPNIQKPGSWKAVVVYVCKGGTFLHKKLMDYSHPGNYSRRLADYELWVSHVAVRIPTEWPVGLGSLVLERPQAVNKQRHIWIHGPPNCGKTWRTWECLDGARVYAVPNMGYPFEGYEHEDIILYDDHFPSFAAIADIAGVCPRGRKMHVFGPTRYRPKYWLPGHVRIIVVLSNQLPAYGTADPAFRARFNVYDVEDVWEGVIV